MDKLGSEGAEKLDDRLPHKNAYDNYQEITEGLASSMAACRRVIYDGPMDDISPPPKRGRPSTQVEVRCALCGGAFKALPSEIARGAGRFCSMEHRDQARGNGIVGTAAAKRDQPDVEVDCKACGAKFYVFPFRRPDGPRPARFCSDVCRRTPPGRWVRR